MATWTAEELETFRKVWIRDFVDTSVTPAVKLSHFNRATGGEFFTDSALQTIRDLVERDWLLELERVEYAARQRELELSTGKSEAELLEVEAAARLDAIFRLCRAECRDLMRADSGYLASVADEDAREDLLEQWRDQAKADRNAFRLRQGPFGSVPLRRR